MTGSRALLFPLSPDISRAGEWQRTGIPSPGDWGEVLIVSAFNPTQMLLSCPR